MNSSEFVCDPSENIYEQVADHIATQVLSGALSPGSMLPNERQLADQYGVAVGTARRAGKLLEERGLIKIRPGKGKFVLTESERRRRREERR